MRLLLFRHTRVGDALAPLAMTMTPTRIIAGALASRDYSPLHHDRQYAREQAGHRDIFVNSPQQTALLERFLGDWSGPRGRLGRMRLAMRSPVYAGDTIEVRGEVTAREIDAPGCGWLELALEIRVDGAVASESQARYALPVSTEDNPWLRRGGDWRP